MWSLINNTPFPVARGFDRDKFGRSHWIVWLKATFVLRPNQTCLFLREQRKLAIAPVYVGDASNSDLIEDVDLVAPKDATDIYAVAHAYRPRRLASGRPFVAGFAVGDVKKLVCVAPPSRWGDDDRLERVGDEHAPVFLGYANAYGGRSHDDEGKVEIWPDNPIGVGYCAAQAACRATPTARLFYSGEDGADWRARPRSAALTPIPREAPRRAKLAGLYDDRWRKNKAPLLPDDFDPEFHQSAPPDQRCSGHLQGGEHIELVNLDPDDHTGDGSVLRTIVPTLAIEVTTRFKGSWRSSLAKIQTLVLLPDERLITLCYAAALPLGAAANDARLDETRVTLRHAGDFVVRAQDADLFHSPGSLLIA